MRRRVCERGVVGKTGGEGLRVRRAGMGGYIHSSKGAFVLFWTPNVNKFVLPFVRTLAHHLGRIIRQHLSSPCESRRSDYSTAAQCNGGVM